MKRGKKTMSQTRNRHKQLDGFQRLFLLLVLCLTALLGTILLGSPETTPGLAGAVSQLQDRSGVESPVTAVLLNFRGYDTLLEVMVLLLAVIGSWSLTKAPLPDQGTEISPVQMGVVRLLAPVMCLVAAYLVWQGSHLAGGAFQGGAILGAAGVLLLVSELPWLRDIPVFPLRIGLVFGPLVFVGTAILCLLFTGAPLGYPEGTAGWLILLIEAACALSIGLTLALLFAGGRPGDEVVEEHNPGEQPCNGESS
jgi:multisubunit Na+/H+ antiporter MnhB subunit